MTAAGFCPNCGKARTGERFCGNCGNDFWTAAQAQGVQVQPAAAPLQEQPQVRERGSNTLLLMFLIPAIIGAVLLGFLTSFNVWGFLIGAVLGGALGSVIQDRWMEVSNYENLRRIGRR